MLSEGKLIQQQARIEKLNAILNGGQCVVVYSTKIVWLPLHFSVAVDEANFSNCCRKLFAGETLDMMSIWLHFNNCWLIALRLNATFVWCNTTIAAFAYITNSGQPPARSQACWKITSSLIGRNGPQRLNATMLTWANECPKQCATQPVYYVSRFTKSARYERLERTISQWRPAKDAPSTETAGSVVNLATCLWSHSPIRRSCSWTNYHCKQWWGSCRASRPFNRRPFECRLKHVRALYAVGHFASLSEPNNPLVSYSRQIAVYNGPLLQSWCKIAIKPLLVGSLTCRLSSCKYARSTS
jgi:hypothetical protein